MPRAFIIGVSGVAIALAGWFSYGQYQSQRAKSVTDEAADDSLYIVDLSKESPGPTPLPISVEPTETLSPQEAPVEHSEELTPQTIASSTIDNTREERANKSPDSDSAEAESIPQSAQVQTSPGSVALSGEVGSLTWEVPDRESSNGNHYRGLSLKLHGPQGSVLEKSSDGYAAITLADGLADGRYHWETVTEPEIDPYVLDQVREAREEGDHDQYRLQVRKLQKDGFYPTRAELERNVSSGSFLVMNGQLVNERSANN